MLKPLTCFFSLCAGAAFAAPDPLEIVQKNVVPRFERLASQANLLEEAAKSDCSPDSPALRKAWAQAFDAWVEVSHLRFGPTEEQDRAFALAFWPDTRGATPKALAGLIASQDPVVVDPGAFADVSIAARGFYAMEYLLFDPNYATESPYACTLIQAEARDISRLANDILAGWMTYQFEFADNSERYRTREEGLQELFKAVTTGLQFTSDTRIGRPMGTFEKPRAPRAEARRSERSVHHVRLSLQATQALALWLAADLPKVSEDIEAAYEKAFAELDAQDSPVFADVDDPTGRFRVEMLQVAVDQVRDVIARELGPELGVIAGFNSQDGD